MDRLHELGRTEPPTDELLASVRTRLLAEAHGQHGGAPRRPRRRRRLVASVGALALVTTGTAAFAASRLSSTATTNTTIECGVDGYIPAESANPILDCYDALARAGGPVPPLTGWLSTTGMVEVLPTGTRPLPGSVPLPARFQVNPGVRYLTDVLGSETGPLQDGCLTASAADAYVQDQLAIAGLAGWTVAMQSAPAGCAAYFGVVDAASSTIAVTGSQAPPSQGDGVDLQLARELDAQLVAGPGARCLDEATALAAAAHDATALGIAASAITVSDGGVVGATGPRCATPFVEPAGYVDAVIWMAPRP